MQHNIDKAIAWYLKAVEYGKAGIASYELGAIFEDDKYGKQDREKSLYYYTKAHKCGKIEATILLAKKYESEMDTDHDPAKAFKYYEHDAKRAYSFFRTRACIKRS